MKIDVYSNMHNEELILPYWLRHYETIADRIFTWDDDSTDTTREILGKHPKVTILPMGKHNSNDLYWTTYVFPQYEQISRGCADWVIVADADEFIYHPNLLKILEEEKGKGTQVIQCQGYSMVSDSLPTTNGQIYDEIKMGLPDRRESKWTIHSTDISIRFAKGRHGPVYNHSAFVRSRGTGIKLLHYRYLGEKYLNDRNMKLFERHKLMHNFTGKYSIQEKYTCPDGSKDSLLNWFTAHKGEAINVVDNP